MSSCFSPISLQRLAARKFDLHGDEIDAGDFLRHRVLDLQPRIGLDEGERRCMARRIRIDQKLERRKAAQFDIVCEPHRRVAQLLAQIRIEIRRGRVSRRSSGGGAARCSRAPRYGSPILPSPATCTSMCRALGMKRFGIDRIVAERGQRFGLAAVVGALEFVRPCHDAHAAAAAAGDRLDDDRPLLRRAKKARVSSSVAGPGVPARTGTPKRSASARARALSPKIDSTCGARPDENQPDLLAGLGELRILAQKAVARMNRVAVRRLGARR